MLLQTSKRFCQIDALLFAINKLMNSQFCCDCTIPKLSGVSAEDASFTCVTMAISGLGYLHAKNILKSKCNLSHEVNKVCTNKNVYEILKWNMLEYRKSSLRTVEWGYQNDSGG